MAQICDFYSESNNDNSQIMGGTILKFGQCFTGVDGVLNSAKFVVKKTGDNGTVVVKVYTLIGTFGTNGKPTGDALAVSNTINVSSLSNNFSLVTFTFSGANKINLLNQHYCLSFESSSGASVTVGSSYLSPTHNGNYFYDYEGTLYASNVVDVCFYVYIDTISPFPSFRRP